MDKLKNIAHSDLRFYQKIISKYQKGKKNLFYLPVMIFRKNMSHVLSQIINAKFQFQLHFHKQSLLFSLITKNIQGTKALLGVKRHILQLLHRPALMKSFESENKTFQMQYEAISELLQFLSYGTYTKITTSYLRWIKNDVNLSNIRSDLSTQKETSWKYYSVLEHRSSAILKKLQMRIWRSDKPLNTGQFSVPLPKRHLLKETDSFYFQENRKIEQAIEQIKKIAEEAKETVIKNSVPGYSSEKKDINRQIDINHISDQVYKMIDHKLKIEKERRGYL